MSSDISRTDDSERQHYKGVVMQQGRVILDRDFNALQEITERRIDADALDFVGPCGTPDNGFAIDAIIPGSPPLWIPPPPLSPPMAHNRDFLISPGTMYVGGQRAVFPPADYGKPPITYSYFDQPDWINPDEPSRDAALEFVYLDLLEQEVSAVEDPDLKDVALGGPDTSQRLRLLKRVKRLKVDSGDCNAAFAQAQALWVNNNLAFDPKTMQLLPQASLQVSFSTSASQPDPCEPVAQGGYLQPENQLIRVQITEGGAGGVPKLLWGYDNASFLYRADISDSQTLLLRQSPVDAFHLPRTGQVVEVLRSALIIDSEQDETDPLKARSIVRCVAEANGVIRTLSTGYQPSDRSIKLDQPLPTNYVNNQNPLFVRIWQSELDLSGADSSTVELVDTSNNSTTGIVVTINMSLAGGKIQAPAGAYWLFAVRPSTPQAVYPERFLTDAQPPDGPRQWVCPLAVIDWTGHTTSPPGSPPIDSIPIVRDCREKFDNLVELTKRKLSGCCAITLHPEDLRADPMALQTVIDKFAGNGEGIAICLTPGTYALAQPLRLDARHNGLTIEACHGAATIQATLNTEVKFLDGLVVLTQSTGVTVRGISFKPPAVGLKDAIAINGGNAGGLPAIIPSLVEPHMMIGLRLLDCTDVSVVDCEFQLMPVRGVSNFAAAIFVSASCRGLSVRQSRFIGPTQKLTSTVVLARQPDQRTVENQAGAVERQGAAGTAAGAEPAANVAGNSGAQPFLHQVFINNPAFLRALNPGASAQPIGPIQVPPLELPPPPIMLSAFMITPSIESLTDAAATGASTSRLLARAVLDEAEFIDNRMQGLTVAVVGVSGAGNVRFRGNSITDCFGGIWFGGINSNDVDEAKLFQTIFSFAGGVKDVGTGLSIAMAFPLPGGKLNSQQSLPTPRFQVTANRIDALPVNGAASGSATVLILDPPSEREIAGTSSLLLNSNDLCNRSDPNVENQLLLATAILFSRSTAVEGNLIQNLETGSAGADTPPVYSLYVASSDASPLAVAGNVFKGKSIIPDRKDITSFDSSTVFGQLNSWRFLNYHKSDQPQ
jgi:hypothetical protein